MIALALIAGAGVVWLTVLSNTEEAGGPCPKPSPPTPTATAAADAGEPAPGDAANEAAAQPPPLPLGEQLPDNALDDVAPVPPQHANVQVFNANGEVGQASIVTGGLAELGFTPVGEPGNDRVYPNFDLDCYGQLRFGEGGEGAARTLSLVLPCAELVREDRAGDMVALALGTEFDRLHPSSEARQVLLELRNLGAPAVANDQADGGEAGEMRPTIDPSLIEQARSEENC